MGLLKKYSLEGQEVGNVEINDEIASFKANGQMIKDYIVAIRNNARQWSASTKTRAEVSHTTKKPHPKPKFNQHVKINQKEKRAAIKSLLAEKINSNSFIVISDIEMESPKTKIVANFIEQQGFRGRTLFLGESSYLQVETEGKVEKVSVKSDKHVSFAKSVRNLPRANFMLAKNISGYDVAIARNIVVTESALQELVNWLN